MYIDICSSPPRKSRQRGLTLIELIMFIVIVGVGITGILAVMNQVVRTSANPMIAKQAMAFADAVLEEVLSKEFANPAGGYTETSPADCAHRALYDDVGDYACFDGSTLTKRIAGTDLVFGASTALLAGYTATVAVAASVVSGITMNLVTVTVAAPDGHDYAVSGYRANY